MVYGVDDDELEKSRIDSGAVKHVCPPTWGSAVPTTVAPHHVKLKIASGEPLTH